MRKVVIALVILCAAAACYFLMTAHSEPVRQNMLEVRQYTRGTLVYTTRAIKKGEILRAEDLVEKEVPMKEIPQDGITVIKIITQYKAKANVDLQASEIVRAKDLVGDADWMGKANEPDEKSEAGNEQ
jgi:Flp pilus assembly protein CpaB